MAEFPSNEAVKERAEFLRGIADDLVGDKVVSDKNVVFRTNRIQLLTEAYFLLNEAYKGWRIKDGHHTQPPKIAALTCMVIQEIQPFLPINPDNATTFQQARANEIFSLACASAILGVSIHRKKQDVYLRLLDVLSKCECETIQPLIVDRSLSNMRELSTYKLSVVEKDKFTMDCLITIFEMLWLAKPAKRGKK